MPSGVVCPFCLRVRLPLSKLKSCWGREGVAKCIWFGLAFILPCILLLISCPVLLHCLANGFTCIFLVLQLGMVWYDCASSNRTQQLWLHSVKLQSLPFCDYVLLLQLHVCWVSREHVVKIELKIVCTFQCVNFEKWTPCINNFFILWRILRLSAPLGGRKLQFKNWSVQDRMSLNLHMIKAVMSQDSHKISKWSVYRYAQAKILKCTPNPLLIVCCSFIQTSKKLC